MRFYTLPDTIAPFWIKAPGVPGPRTWEDNNSGIAQTSYDFQQTKDENYYQYFHIWKKGEFIARYRGKLGMSGYMHCTQYFKQPVPSPGALRTLYIGDFGGGPDRHAETLIDEVYIYNRALTYEECQWASVNALSRKQGMDIPGNFAQPSAKVVPDT
jgi:hypothetical protein